MTQHRPLARRDRVALALVVRFTLRGCTSRGYQCPCAPVPTFAKRHLQTHGQGQGLLSSSGSAIA